MKSAQNKVSYESKSPSTSKLNDNLQKLFFSPLKQKSEALFSTDFIQPKLKIGQPGDKYEKEADRVADTVMRIPDPMPREQPLDDDDKVQMKPLGYNGTGLLQMKCKKCEEEEKKLRKKPAIQMKGNGQYYASPAVTGRINATKGRGQPLPGNTQTEMAHKMGSNFSDVKVHTDSNAVHLNQKLGARAFTHGKDIYFNSNQYNPTTSAGKHLLAHELTHVVQQNFIDNLLIRSQKNITSWGAINSSSPYVARQTEIHADLTGHASPRWEHTHGYRRAELNMQLSEDRVESVRLFFEEMLRNAFRARGLDVEITYESRNVDEPAPVGAVDSASISAGAMGSTVTEREASGNVHANKPEMRRVDVKVTVTWQVPGEALSSESEEVTIPEECEPNATDRWSIKLVLSGGAGHAGGGVAGALGVLKNRLTGQTAQGSFQGGGLGVGLSSPGADPGWGDFSDFRTDSLVTFEDFDGTLARLTTAGAGIAIIGGGLAWISFPMLGANSIFVGGFNMGQFGADMGTNVGSWNVIGRPPGPHCTPEHTEQRAVVRSVPYNTAMPNVFFHRVLFETGSAEIPDEELHKLQDFVDLIMANYEYTGIQETHRAR